MEDDKMHEDVKRTSISTNQFSPMLLMCSMFTQGATYPKGYRLDARYVYDYEMEYILYSEGLMVVEGTEYPIQKGDIVFRRPGQYVQGIMPYTCYVICFDLLGNTGKNPATYDFTKEQEFQSHYKNPILDAIPSVFSNPYPEKYHKIFEYIFKEYITMNEGSELIMKTYLLQLLYQLFMDVRNPLLSHRVPTSPYYIPIKSTLEFIESNYRHKISLELLANEVKLSSSHFHKIFSKVMNMSPNEYLTKVRLEKAKELLVKTDLNIFEIALQCGFENTPYFNFIFKKHLGMSPGEFRKRLSYI